MHDLISIIKLQNNWSVKLNFMLTTRATLKYSIHVRKLYWSIFKSYPWDHRTSIKQKITPLHYQTNKTPRKELFTYSWCCSAFCAFLYYVLAFFKHCEHHIIILIKVHKYINAGNFAWISKSLQSAKFGPKFCAKYSLGRLFLPPL